MIEDLARPLLCIAGQRAVRVVWLRAARALAVVFFVLVLLLVVGASKRRWWLRAASWLAAVGGGGRAVGAGRVAGGAPPAGSAWWCWWGGAAAVENKATPMYGNNISDDFLVFGMRLVPCGQIAVDIMRYSFDLDLRMVG